MRFVLSTRRPASLSLSLRKKNILRSSTRSAGRLSISKRTPRRQRRSFRSLFRRLLLQLTFLSLFFALSMVKSSAIVTATRCYHRYYYYYSCYYGYFSSLPCEASSIILTLLLFYRLIPGEMAVFLGTPRIISWTRIVLSSQGDLRLTISRPF